MKNNAEYLVYILYGLLAVSMAALLFSLVAPFVFQKSSSSNQPPSSSQMKTGMSRMTLTGFDRELAKQFMDKDGDGKCDACGMPVEMCIDSGQLQCNMDPKSTMGVLGSVHLHADFKVFVDGKPVNFADSKHYMKSSFLHVDDSQKKDDASGVLHMHATGVPLWVFFKSIGMELPDSMKLYVNGEVNEKGLEYVFKEGDKLLLTTAMDAGTIQQQLSAITDFAKAH